MRLLQLNKLSNEGVHSLKSSFDNLPETSHADGKYRLRRYSVVELRTTFWNAAEEIVVEKLETREFLQSEDLNKHQGGMSRKFEDLEDSTIQSEGFKEICHLFKNSNNLVDGQEIEVHQMRIVTLDSEDYLTKNGPWVVTPVSPEGVHQDGFDHIAMIGINRNNIEGGELKAYHPDNRDTPMLSKPLGAGDMFMLQDSVLFHDASPIRAIRRREKGYLDAFVLCARTA
tara:strand:- start:19339 stop:20022 length:684 start_codon:yes stop_codon:yes gene_type:complete